MALHKTQCPHCFTNYVISEEQYRVSEGMVRCGTCRERFQVNLTDSQQTPRFDPRKAFIEPISEDIPSRPIHEPEEPREIEFADPHTESITDTELIDDSPAQTHDNDEADLATEKEQSRADTNAAAPLETPSLSGAQGELDLPIPETTIESDATIPEKSENEAKAQPTIAASTSNTSQSNKAPRKPRPAIDSVVSKTRLNNTHRIAPKLDASSNIFITPTQHTSRDKRHRLASNRQTKVNAEPSVGSDKSPQPVAISA